MRPFRERPRSEQRAVGCAEGHTECRGPGDEQHRKEVEWVTMPRRLEWPRGTKHEQNAVAWAPERLMGLLAECVTGGAESDAEAVGGGPSS